MASRSGPVARSHSMADKAPARGRRAARVSGDERERAILATAERLLESRSIQDVSVDDLARGAGISRPAFYFYFPSKEAVLLSLLDRVVEEARSGIQLDFASADPRQALRRSLGVIHATFRDHRAVTAAATSLRATSPAVRELWSSVMETFVQETADVIEAERARGSAPAGPAARDLAVALNRMNERVLQASFEGEQPALGAPRDPCASSGEDLGAEAVLIDTLVEIWFRAVYGRA